ncbi:hypothetical protein M434DRAFT_398001 [Hypoxylon sp. CO27-5]|nr:hypothetical protein M434DRAFT_398001 [Hypoxylon sp. CO27-5]
MVRTSRGIAGERAAVLKAQKDDGLRLDREERRRKPSLGELETPLKTADGTMGARWSPVQLISLLQVTKFDILEGRRPDALPLKIEKYLDMAPIKKGSFMFMSKNYIDERTNCFGLDEDLDWATF